MYKYVKEERRGAALLCYQIGYNANMCEKSLLTRYSHKHLSGNIHTWLSSKEDYYWNILIEIILPVDKIIPFTYMPQQR